MPDMQLTGSRKVERIDSLELMEDGEYAVALRSGIRLQVGWRFPKALQQRLGLAPRNKPTSSILT